VALTPKAGIGLTVLAVAMGLLGLALAYTFYLAPGAAERRRRITTPLAPVRELLKHKYYVDELYGAVIVRPALALANAAATFDANVIDGAVMGVGRLVGRGSAVLRRIQSGLVRRYVMTMLGGIVLVVAIFLVAGR
jgi:NADH-quinone oxidoreductase subunit L